MRENVICAFLQNMRNMLQSHDRYKPVSLCNVETVTHLLVAHRSDAPSHSLAS